MKDKPLTMSVYNNIKVAVLAILVGQMAHPQGTSTPHSQENPVYIEGFNYPKFDDLSNYAWFRLNFRAREGTEMGLGGEHYRRYDADRFSLSLRLKQKISAKSHFLGGYLKEWDLNNKGRGHPNPMPRQEVFFGVEHETLPNMLLEAQIVRPVGQFPGFNKIGLEGVGSHIQMGTKVKF